MFGTLPSFEDHVVRVGKKLMSYFWDFVMKLHSVNAKIFYRGVCYLMIIFNLTFQ